MTLSRRRFLALTAAAGTGVAGGGRASTATAGAQAPAVGLEPVAEGLTAPLGFEDPPGADRQYVVDQSGVVVALGPDGRELFLDVTDRTVDLGGGYDERGLLGLAFHPGFPDDDRVFVRYSAPPRDGTPDGYDHTFVLAEFRASPGGADPGSERTILEVPEPQSNHNAGPVAFGPDGYLYVAVGDGGAGGDRGRGHVEDWYDAVGGGNGQDVTENLLGSVLRIDVDSRTGDRPYGIPADNPLVGREGLDEHYAWGFRNPWGMSFGPEGRLFVADVGQSQYEEVDVVEKGGNYGWNVREGRHCYSADSCPDATPGGQPLREPIVEYGHDRGIAVVGGHFYRGRIGALSGSYVFGDWSSSFGSPAGSLFAATPSPRDEPGWAMTELSIAGRENGELGRFLLGIGQGTDGELYVCTTGRPGVDGTTGAVHRIVPADGERGSTGGTGTAATTTTPAGDGTTTTDGGSGDRGLPGFGPAAAVAGLGIGAGLARLVGTRDEE